MAIDPRLLGGKFTTEAQLAENPEALLARQAGLDQGFAGGEQWGQNRFSQFQQGLSSAPAPITTVSQPLFEQPTIDYNQLANRINIPEVDYGRIGGLMTPLQQGQQGLTLGQGALHEGQQELGLGQQALGLELTNIGAGQAGLADTVGQVGQQVGGVQAGVTGLQQTVGQAATDQAPATGLYAGQTGLMAGQQQLQGTLGRDISGVGADIAGFQRAMEAYQRGADVQRGDIQAAGLSGREQIQRQVGDVGIQANRAAEQMAAARQQMLSTPQGAALLGAGATPGGMPQQAAQFAQTAQNFQQQPSPVQQQLPLSPMGPVSVDPRLLPQAGLMRQ